MKSIPNSLSIFKGKVPGQLIIQYTDKCNVQCQQCGIRASENFKRSKLDIDCIKYIIDHAANSSIEITSLTGGEPFLFVNEIVELLNYAKKTGIKYRRTGTNGFIFTGSDKPVCTTRITEICFCM